MKNDAPKRATKICKKHMDSLSIKEFKERMLGVSTDTERCKEIANFLKLVRKNKGLTQASLARKTGIGKTYISKIENGVKIQRLDTFIKILDALNIILYIQTEEIDPLIKIN